VLINRYDDGVLLCVQGDEGRCARLGESIGERTVCRVQGAAPIELGEGESRNSEEPLTGAVLAVETFERDDLVAVVWMGSDEENAWPRVTWLALRTVEDPDSSPLEVIGEEVDVCEACSNFLESESVGAPRHSYVGFQTASRGESVLLAGPCGSREVLEVARDGSCRRHGIVPSASPHVPEIALGVMETTEGWAAFWTDGLGVYATPAAELDGEVVFGEPRLLHPTLETQSREDPAAICIEPVANEPLCVIAWTEVTRFGSVDPVENREQSIHFDFFVSEELQGFLGSEVASGRAIDTGYGARASIVLQPDILSSHLNGVQVSRHLDHGLVARRWETESGDAENREMRVHMVPRFVQLSAADAVSDFSIYWTSEETFGVVWVEQTRDEPVRIGLGVLGALLDENTLSATRVVVPGLRNLQNLSHFDENYPRPLLTRGETDDGRRILFFAVQDDTGDGCSTRFVMLDLSSLDPYTERGDWPDELEATILGEAEVPTPGACIPGCTGEVAAVDYDAFMVGLPRTSGVAVWRVALVEEGAPLDVELIGSSSSDEAPGCHVTIQGEPTGMMLDLFHDYRHSPGVSPSLGSMYLHREEDGDWTVQPLPVGVWNAAGSTV